MEDGVALAICLEKSGKQKVQQAVWAYKAVRYERVHQAQKTGVSTREQWHKADWDKIRKDPTSLHPERDPWLLDFDHEAHTYAVLDQAVAQLCGKESAEGADIGGPGAPNEKTSGLPTVVHVELTGAGQYHRRDCSTHKFANSALPNAWLGRGLADELLTRGN